MLLAAAGCRSSADLTFGDSVASYQAFVQQIEYPDARECPDRWAAAAVIPPPTVRNLDEIQYTALTLDEAIQLALTHSDVIRQVGGRIVTSTAGTSTVYDPAIIEMDPRFGTEAALAAFDAELFGSLQLQRLERENNNFFSGGGISLLNANLADFIGGIRKTTATGTQFSFENVTNYNRNNIPSEDRPRPPGVEPVQRFSSVYETLFSANVRHPLLRGGGLEFNRIAGPGATPGNYRGVLLARINSDIALADFETSVRDLLFSVEQAYWQLYFAYRDLDAALEFRAYALETWQLERQRVEAQTRPPDQEAFVREQFYEAQAAVENALSGRSGSPGVLGAAGVLGAENQLRSVLGLPASDGRLLRPSTPPLQTDIQYDWHECLSAALVRRVELRRQRWVVKQRELELIAARNFRLPQLDVIGQYNWRGFDDNLFGANSAFSSLADGDLQGWIMGLEMRTPIGHRQGHAAVRHAELLLRREQVLLDEQERQISLELRAAFTELARAYAVSRSNYNRYVAAHIQLDAERRRNAVGATRLDLVLDAQRRAVVSEIAFHLAIVDYNQAISRLHLARGTLLDSLQVYLTEGPWSAEAHVSAERQARRFRDAVVPHRQVVPPPVSAGEYPQAYPDRPAAEILPLPAVNEGA